jgi:hypothetical protein
MTIPSERLASIAMTNKFLVDLLDPKQTPKVPKYIREYAARCLRHYPWQYHMEIARVELPEIFGDGVPKPQGVKHERNL